MSAGERSPTRLCARCKEEIDNGEPLVMIWVEDKQHPLQSVYTRFHLNHFTQDDYDHYIKGNK